MPKRSRHRKKPAGTPIPASSRKYMNCWKRQKRVAHRARCKLGKVQRLPPGSSTPNLPYELIDLVLHHLSLFPSSTRTLAHCCRVSHAFDSLARPLLFHRFQVKVGGVDVEGNHHISKASWSFAGVLLAIENLGPMVQEIELDAEDQLDPVLNHSANFSGFLELVLKLCPNLKRLTVPPRLNWTMFYALDGLRRMGRAPAVEVLDVSLLDSRGWDILQQLPEGRLSRLEVAPLDNWPDLLVAAPLTNHQITSLDIFFREEVLSPILGALYDSVASTLTHLSVYMHLDAIPTLSRFPHLTHLRLAVAHVDDKADFLASFPSRLLPQCNNLHTLTIAPSPTFTLSNIRTLSSSDSGSLSSHLPTSLVALHFDSPHFFPSDLLQFVAASTSATNLRQLGRRPYCLPRSQRDRRKRSTLPTPEEETELEEACARRGIRVVALP